MRTNDDLMKMSILVDKDGNHLYPDRVPYAPMTETDIRDTDLFSDIQTNFPFILGGNPNALYNEGELNMAKECFVQRDMDKFNNPERIIKVFACLIRSVQSDVDYMKATVEAERSKHWNNYIESINALPAVITKLQAGEISEIVFKGNKSGDNIKITSDLIMYAIRQAIANMYGSKTFQNKHLIYAGPAQPGTLIEMIKKNRSAATVKKHSTAIKNTLSFRTFKYLDSYTKPGVHSNYGIIGRLLAVLELAPPYIGSADDSSVLSYIKEGEKITNNQV